MYAASRAVVSIAATTSCISATSAGGEKHRHVREQVGLGADERLAERRVAGLVLQRLAQRPTVERDAEAVLVEPVREGLNCDQRKWGLDRSSIAKPWLRPDRTRFKPEVGVEYSYDHRCPSVSVSRPIPSAASVLAIDSSALLIVPVSARIASIVSGMTIA